MVSGTPYWVGVVVAGAAVSVTLALGGMRAATYVQAFQFVLKLVLFVGPAIWLVAAGRAHGARGRRWSRSSSPASPTTTPVQFRFGTTLTVTEPTTVVDGGAPRQLVPGEHPVEAGTTWTFPAGADVPDVAGAFPPGGDALDAVPCSTPTAAATRVLSTLSLLMALVLGTMGLPHIIVRFHTSPDGRSARRTAAITVALLSAFYLFPVVYGTLGARAGAGAVPLRRHRHASWWPSRSGSTVARWAWRSRRCSRRARSRRSSPRRSGCCSRCPAPSRTTCCPARGCGGCAWPRSPVRS